MLLIGGDMTERESVKVLREAIELQLKKSQDYQNPASRVVQADYYPNGIYSILDIMNAKVLRIYSVLDAMHAGDKVNFESVEDSCVDLINYASFMAAYMRGEISGQKPDRDIFNRSGQTNQDLIPVKFR
jgi:hypothetical protein